ncbi:MAG: PBP1A family penicillin-binding protein [Deltaproteobacteria bacterium]|nr:PBP1A family penicillin-binding protein [Deltaproteobacteria bacterium]
MEDETVIVKSKGSPKAGRGPVRPDDVTQEVPTVAPARRSRLVRITRALAVTSVVGLIVGGIGVLVTLTVLARDLPEIDSLADYQPHQATTVMDPDGNVVARFAKERRTLVPIDQVPDIMLESVVAAEDATFWTHEGLDYFGIARCAVKNTLAGRKVCGGSTITQQTVKTFFLTPEKSMARKLKEMILATRLEQALSKRDILYLYLNQIYYGHGAYGVQEASRTYFGRNVDELTVEQAALLAGLPQAPSSLDPYKHPDRALKRRAYVLRRLLELEKIDQATHDAAVAAPLDLDWDRDDSNWLENSHYAAYVRAILEDRFGEEQTLSGGLKVYTGVQAQWQKTAEEAVQAGLRALDKRQGWRGPLLHLEADELKAVRARLTERRAQVGDKRKTGEITIWDLSPVERLPRPLPAERVAQAARFPRFAMERIYAGVVVESSDSAQEAVVDLGGVQVHLPLRTGLSWARAFSVTKWTRRPRTPSEVVTVGDVVLVRPTAEKSAGHYIGVLEQLPKAEAALVAIDPHTREVRALVGGYGMGAGRFNRAVQARRQAGSTFKPFVYGAAFEHLGYTPVTKCLDAPRVYYDEWLGKTWKPQNYGKKFDGEITLRTALTLSKNICSVELIDKLKPDAVLDLARRAGIKSNLPRNLTLALGSGDVTPLEMTNAYATLASGGLRADPVFIRKIVDPAGKVLYEDNETPEQTVAPDLTYLITSLMQSVVEDGTAQRVKVLERPVAGKTGTTNEARNAWFVGFTPDLVAGVWVGFDNNDPLGPSETGGRAAIPIWLDFMQAATQGAPVNDFVAPANVVFATVDPKTGKLAAPESDGAVVEPFISGTEPTEFATGAEPPDEFMLDEYE